MSTDCHVRKLRIRTRDKTVLPRITFAIEDAFRTASFPGVPPNGRVFVKRLDLGNFSSAASSRFLAGRIDELFRHISPVMVCQDIPELIDASAVWFPDDLSPYRYLVNLLAQNRRPRAWYWKAAVKEWHPSLSVHQSFQVIVSRISQYETGIRGMYFVLAPLVENGRILDVLETLPPRDVTRYLFNMGLTPIFIDPMKSPGKKAVNAKEPPMIVPAREGEMVARAAGLWSIFDPRFALASYLILVQMDQTADPVHLNRLLEKVSNRPVTADDNEKPKKEQDTMGTADQDAGCEVLEKKFKAPNPSDGVPSETVDTRPQGPGDKAQETQTQGIYKDKSAAVTTREKVTDRKEAPPTEPVSVDGHAQALYPPDHTVASNASEPPSPESKQVQSPPLEQHALREIWPDLGGFAGEITEYAGLLFTIPLMKIIGMDTLMERFPAYENLDLPRRILFRCARLFSISPDDPVLVFLGKKPEPADVIPEFTAPSQWQRILPEPSSKDAHFHVTKINNFNGYGLGLDSEKPLMIGVWHPENRGRMNPWFDRYPIDQTPVVSRDWSLDRLVDTMVTAMERYCRNTATMAFWELIRRPGYIAATKTHLDLTFPFSQLDIRVRMAGLDINPGWVPWLGRVFQFHYVGGNR